MTQKETRIFAVFCGALLVLAGCILLRFYDRVNERTVMPISSTSEITGDTVSNEFSSGYSYTTECSQLVRDKNGDISKRTFTHKIYTQEGDYFSAISITVTGSIAADECTISHVSTSLSDDQQGGITISEHISDDTATVVLYRNQISVSHFQYRLSPNGTIDPL